jgi:hypothetical protein
MVLCRLRSVLTSLEVKEEYCEGCLFFSLYCVIAVDFSLILGLKVQFGSLYFFFLRQLF